MGIRSGGAEGNRTLDLLNAIYMQTDHLFSIIVSIDRYNLIYLKTRGYLFIWYYPLFYFVWCTKTAQKTRGGTGDHRGVLLTKATCHTYP